MKNTETLFYELMIVLDADLEEGKINEKIETLTKQIQDLGGEIKHKDTIGKRRLGYIIKKKDSGFYVVFNFNIEGIKLKEIETTLRLDKNCLRFLMMKLPANYEYQTVQEIERRIPIEQGGNIHTPVPTKAVETPLMAAKEEVKEEKVEAVREPPKDETVETQNFASQDKDMAKEEKKPKAKKEVKKTDKDVLNDLDKALASFIEDPSINV